MDERVMQFRVGVMFLATLIITGILLVMFGKLPTLIGRNYVVQIRFDYAGGISKGSPVRKSGVLIGRVTDVQLTDADSKVLVTAEIQSDKILYQNEEPYITRDLLGDTALVFIADPKRPGAGQRIPPGAILDGLISDDPTGLKKALESPINTVVETGKALTAASKQLGEAAHRVEEILDPETQKDAKALLRDAAASLASIRKMLGDDENREKLSQAMQSLPETLNRMNATFKATDETLQKFSQRSADGKTPIERMVNTIELTERTLRKFSQPGAEGELAPADQIAKAMENVNEITDLMRSILCRVDRGEGSLGALLKDRQLYDRLNRAARNIEQVSQELKPIVDDARVFSDKIARHPGVIVRDAVKPGVGIK
jgi:phospholipid/cholesterol/gamma-HCH transport system substrate-binding protein